MCLFWRCLRFRITSPTAPSAGPQIYYTFIMLAIAGFSCLQFTAIKIHYKINQQNLSQLKTFSSLKHFYHSKILTTKKITFHFRSHKTFLFKIFRTPNFSKLNFLKIFQFTTKNFKFTLIFI
jgi:hypothetical protein